MIEIPAKVTAVEIPAKVTAADILIIIIICHDLTNLIQD
jgi:hypothetical protein